ncbi:MAG: DnaA regulatory inactivator Hda [Gammaproteobacteria bacterium]|nr:DnaA regulatory inactivator Hda [Gammaproteobacteria bacterium]
MQLSLSIGLRDDASFDNFFPGENTVAVKHLENILSSLQSEGSVYLWGHEASGKTHLLQALCHQATSLELSAAYLPLSQWRELDVAMLEGLENYAIVCIDDVDAIAGNVDWEQALFHLYNQIFSKGTHLVVSASSSLQDSPLQLPDLKSRLSWGIVFQIKELSEEDKVLALQHRAHRRGLELPENVAQYLLRRYSRDMNSLLDILNRLDEASLVAKRKLTVPFVKQWLEVL